MAHAAAAAAAAISGAAAASNMRDLGPEPLALPRRRQGGAQRERSDQTAPWEHPSLGQGPGLFLGRALPQHPSTDPCQVWSLRASTGLFVSATQCCLGAEGWLCGWTDGQTEGPSQDKVGNSAQTAWGPCRKHTGTGERLPLQMSPVLEVGPGQECLWV